VTENLLNPKVDEYIQNAGKWRDELEALREILLDCQLHEEIKWGVPCYTFQKRNVVLMHIFKEYCALLFFKGSLLKDTSSLLTQQTTNVQAGRQVRFTSVSEISGREPVLKAYVLEAIELEKTGERVNFKKTAEFNMPAEFQEKLGESPGLQTAFEALTPGRQRAYILYFTAPKQSQTRIARIEKFTPKILAGKGLND